MVGIMNSASYDIVQIFDIFELPKNHHYLINVNPVFQFFTKMICQHIFFIFKDTFYFQIFVWVLVGNIYPWWAWNVRPFCPGIPSNILQVFTLEKLEQKDKPDKHLRIINEHFSTSKNISFGSIFTFFQLYNYYQI